VRAPPPLVVSQHTSGDIFHREITDQIDKAGAVVVIWTEGAVASDWVYAEAQRGAAQKKLVPLRDPSLAHDRIPLPFSVFHIDDAENDGAIVASVMSRRGPILPLSVAPPGRSAELLPEVCGAGTETNQALDRRRDAVTADRDGGCFEHAILFVGSSDESAFAAWWGSLWPTLAQERSSRSSSRIRARIPPHS
jgi:hypothetical protein